jgi:uncharacterized membrane protein
MNKIVEFLKTSLGGGILVLLPLVMLYLLLDEIIEILIALATPIADLFPPGLFDNLELPGVIALVLLVGTSFLFGLALRSETLRRFGHWLERILLGKLPLYNAVKSLSRGLVGAKEDGVFKPAIMHSDNGEREIVYLIEEDGKGQVTVLVPWAPASFAGSLKIMSRDRIELLDSNLGDTSRVLSHWGVGTFELLEKIQSGSSNGK